MVVSGGISICKKISETNRDEEIGLKSAGAAWSDRDHLS
jgi:hypothetical protein